MINLTHFGLLCMLNVWTFYYNSIHFNEDIQICKQFCINLCILLTVFKIKTNFQEFQTSLVNNIFWKNNSAMLNHIFGESFVNPKNLKNMFIKISAYK